tara:strand:+ start:713 stop:1036 length:324 start_codon:yes stop_codon:yes gene_type:complete
MPPVKVVTTLPISWKEFEVGEWAYSLLSANKVACIQIDKIRSMYLWQNNVNSEEEWRLSMTTTQKSSTELINRIKTNHPYEIPQIVWHSVNADEEYHNWINEVTKDE